MTDIYLADVSEYQGHVDWATYTTTNPAAIARVCYGTSHLDKQWAVNLIGMRTHLRARGFYQYVVASQDVVAQAKTFAALVGPLQPGEFAIADIEDGSFTQADFQRWTQVVHAQIGGVEGEYSGLAFARTHLADFAGAPLAWVAAYGQGEPSDAHQLWQFTDRRAFPGIAAPCDASVFHGSIDQLLALINPATPPQEADNMAKARCFIYTRDAVGNPGPWWLTDGFKKRPIAPGENQLLVDLGLVDPGPDGKPTVKPVSPAQLAAIPNA